MCSILLLMKRRFNFTDPANLQAKVNAMWELQSGMEEELHRRRTLMSSIPAKAFKSEL